MSGRLLLACALILASLSGIKSGCGGKTFEPSCQYVCRCSEGLSCDPSSGECDGPCMPGWMGESCQFVNIAYQSPALLKTRQTNRLTDGDLYTNEMIEFTHGDTISVDLRFGYLIDSLTVYTNDYGRYQYSIFLKEKLNQVENKTCYDNISTAKKTFVRCRTRQFGRYVYLRFNGVVNHLIVYEVEINGGRNLAISKSVLVSKSRGTPIEESSLTDGQPMWNSSGADCNTYIDSYKFTVPLKRISTIVSVRLTVDSFDGNPSNLIIHRGLKATITTTIETRMRSMYNYIFLSLMSAAQGDEIFVMTTETIYLCEIEIFVFCINASFGMDCENTCDCSTPINNAKCPHECRGGVVYRDFSRGSTTLVPASTLPSDSATMASASTSSSDSTVLVSAATLPSDTTPIQTCNERTTDDNITTVVVGAAVGCVILLIILNIVILCLLWRRRRNRQKPASTTPVNISPIDVEYETLNQSSRLNDNRADYADLGAGGKADVKSENEVAYYENFDIGKEKVTSSPNSPGLSTEGTTSAENKGGIGCDNTAYENVT